MGKIIIQEKPDNVIQFERSQNITDQQFHNLDQQRERITRNKQEFCDEVLDYSMEHLLNCISSFGFFMDESRIETKDLVMLEQAIQALLYRYYNLEHQMHDVTEQIIDLEVKE